MNYKKTVRKSHDTGWENSHHTYSNVFMLGNGCDVFQYPHFFVKGLYMYQMLPRPYLRSFDGCSGDKLIKKMCDRLGKSSINICLGVY